MKKEIVYLKEINNYDEILKKEHSRMPLFFKKIVFMFKNIFNIITKKKIENANIWILPMKDKNSINKIEKIVINKLISNNRYVISNQLATSEILNVLDKHNRSYLEVDHIKRMLLIHILKYISEFIKKDINLLDVTILVNSCSELNLYLIEEIAKIVKSIKIVSMNIYKFKEIEKHLYNQYGIPIQFSNSYKKSLEKSKIIINFDFNETEVNEYVICNNAIIVNCTREKIKIKTRIFEGVIINSLEINFKKYIVEKFKKMNIYSAYNNLILYASLLEAKGKITEIYTDIENDQVKISNLIGNNGYIDKKELKNVYKKLDKN